MSKSKWTQFWDMHSGGEAKLWRHPDGKVNDDGGHWSSSKDAKPVEKIYIEAPQKEAEIVFYNRFHRSPERVTCTCCGSDYSVTESDSLEQATAYHRGCGYEGKKWVDKPSNDYRGEKYMTVEQYEKQPDVLVIRASDIKPEERVGELPEEGYIWQD